METIFAIAATGLYYGFILVAFFVVAWRVQRRLPGFLASTLLSALLANALWFVASLLLVVVSIAFVEPDDAILWSKLPGIFVTVACYAASANVFVWLVRNAEGVPETTNGEKDGAC